MTTTATTTATAPQIPARSFRPSPPAPPARPAHPSPISPISPTPSRVSASFRVFGRALGMAAMALGLALGGSGCSLIVEQGTTQCETNEDCAGFDGAICSAEKVCISLAAAGCTAHSECTARHGNDYVCAPAEGGARACKNLLSERCQTLAGTPAVDGAIIVGSIGPTTGTDSGIGIPIENAIRVAVGDFREASAQILDKPRGLVMVGCTDESSTDVALEATEHLLSLGSPAIIGAAFSGITADISDATIPAGALLMSPSATAVGLGDIVDESLVWRTAPPDTFQAQAIARYIEQRLRVQVAETPLRVAVLHRGDDYGKDLGRALEEELLLNGARPTDAANAGNYVRFGYGDPDDPQNNPADFEGAIAAALAIEPHIVVLAGYSEAVNDVFLPIEQAIQSAPAPGPFQPFYVMTDGVVGSDLWSTIGTNNALRQRVSGTTPGRARSNPVFQAFKTRYAASFSDGGAEVFGSAEAYDALYLIAYSAATIDPATAVTGRGLAQGFGKLVPPGTSIDAGVAPIPSAIDTLRAGEKIDFTGASGPLDFELGKGEAAADIQIWCLRREADGRAGSNVLSGLYLDAADPDTLKGTVNTTCAP